MSQRENHAQPMDASFQMWARRPTIEAACTRFFAASVALFLLSLLQRMFGGNAAISLLVSVGYELCALFIPVLAYILGHPGAARGMRFSRPKLVPALIAIPAAVVGVFFYTQFGTLWLALLEALGLPLSTGDPARFASLPGALTTLLVSAVLPALCEETFFRGMMLHAFIRRGNRYAIALSALLFALLHGTIEGLPVQFGAGVVLGVLVVATDSLYVGMIYHLTHNAVMLLLAGATPYGAVTRATGQRALDALGGLNGAFLTLLTALGLALLYVGLVTLACYMAAPREQAGRVDPSPMSTPAFFLLTAGIVTCAARYALTLAGLLG